MLACLHVSIVPPQPPNRLLAALAPYVSPAPGQPYLVDLAADLGRPVNLRLSDRSCVELDCNLNINAALGRLSNAVGRRQQGGRLVPCLTSVACRCAWRLASCNKHPPQQNGQRAVLACTHAIVVVVAGWFLLRAQGGSLGHVQRHQPSGCAWQPAPHQCHEGPAGSRVWTDLQGGQARPR